MHVEETNVEWSRETGLGPSHLLFMPPNENFHLKYCQAFSSAKECLRLIPRELALFSGSQHPFVDQYRELFVLIVDSGHSKSKKKTPLITQNTESQRLLLALGKPDSDRGATYIVFRKYCLGHVQPSITKKAELGIFSGGQLQI